MVLFPFMTCSFTSSLTLKSTTMNRKSPRTLFEESTASHSRYIPTGTVFRKDNSCPMCSVPPGIFRSLTTPRRLNAAIDIGGAIFEDSATVENELSSTANIYF